VVLAYEQLLPEQDGSLRYTYSLPTLEQDSAARIKNFRFELEALGLENVKHTNYTAKISSRDGRIVSSYKAGAFIPAGPIHVMATLPRETDHAALFFDRHGEKTHFMIDHVPALATSIARRPVKNLVLGIDTSAGLGQRIVSKNIAIANAILKKLPPSTAVKIVTGDYRARVCDSDPTPEAARACLEGITAGGGTNLSAMIEALDQQARAFGQDTAVVLMSDGAASLGEMDGDLLATHVERAFGQASGAHFHTVAVGLAPNEDGLLQFARSGRGQTLRVTPVEDPEESASRILDQITKALLEEVRVEVVDGKITHLMPSKEARLAAGEPFAI
ncbi:unnamed protein product, partial [Laminaria digitata]